MNEKKNMKNSVDKAVKRGIIYSTGGVMDTMDITVNLLWDEEARVWVATSDDVPGLILESGSYDALVERVKYAIPELLELNNIKSVNNMIFTSQRMEKLAVCG